MLDWHEIWSGFGPETKGALIGAIATAITGLLGLAAVLWQISSQSRANREGIAENERRRLKAELYEETVAVCANASNKVTAFSSSLRLAGQLLEISAAANEQKMPPQVPGSRFPDILQAHGDMVDAAIEFIFVIERRQIVDPRILVFRTAINVALHDLNEIFNREFVPLAIPSLPAELPDGRVIFQAPTVRAAQEFRDVANRVADAASMVGTWVEDFLVEMQNVLLGDLFKTEAVHRIPIDPQMRVVRLDQHEELERYFATETPWGKQAARIEKKTRARFAAEHPSANTGRERPENSGR